MKFQENTDVLDEKIKDKAAWLDKVCDLVERHPSRWKTMNIPLVEGPNNSASVTAFFSAKPGMQINNANGFLNDANVPQNVREHILPLLIKIAEAGGRAEYIRQQQSASPKTYSQESPFAGIVIPGGCSF